MVLNGAGYDGWAEKAQLDKKRQTIVNVGGLMGVTATDEHEHSHDHAEGEEGRLTTMVLRTRTCGSARKPC